MLTTQTECAARNLLERMADARRESDALFDMVRPSALYDRPIPERHRIIFYVGHLEAFDWNLLHTRFSNVKSFDPRLDQLFAFGIDPVDGGLPSDRASDWPAVESVREYVGKIRADLDKALERHDRLTGYEAADGFSLGLLLNVAVEHRLMHVETLSYMLHQLPFASKVRRPAVPLLNTAAVSHRMITIPAGVATLGLPRAGGSFGWDNEYEAYTVSVPAFEIDKYKVTNRQYLEFMNAGGYETRSIWSDEDWAWKAAAGVQHPSFWTKANGEWVLRGMFDEVPLPREWPVYVSHAEARAYARWAGKALPTEEEWHRAAYGTSKGTERDYPWGNNAPDATFGNFDLRGWDPMPVNAFPKGASAFGVEDMLGNGWEWTVSHFAPFPRFEPFPFYPGYSANFVDGKHFVMKGGSARTAKCMLRRTFRNWFQAHYPYIYSGFRCVSR